MPSFINAVSFVDYRIKSRDGKFNNIIKKFRTDYRTCACVVFTVFTSRSPGEDNDYFAI